MSKVMWKPGTFIYPIPAVMVSCGDMEKSNIITVAWTGILNTNSLSNNADLLYPLNVLIDSVLGA